jgi:hypothetical protein
MLKKIVIQKTLRQTWESDDNPGFTNDKLADGQSSIVSRLIYDIFGGEILKTRKRGSWHFYNRIDGELVDFTRPDMVKSSQNSRLDDIPSTPVETSDYFEQADYSNLYFRFVRLFEEAIGLQKFRYQLS